MQKPKQLKTRKNKLVQNILICPCAIAHEERRQNGLSEEQDTRDLERGYLEDTSCSARDKVIANKAKLLDEESLNETIFNDKWLFFTCENFNSARKEPCNF